MAASPEKIWETRIPGDSHDTVTLHTRTSTPRARSLTATFKRVRTPPGESQPAMRQREKNEGKARARAVCRLNPIDHERYKAAERARNETRKRAVASCLLYTSPSPRDGLLSRMPSSA